MCLIIFNWQPHSKRMLTLASNRDEFYARPSKTAHYWDDYPDIFAGRDLKMNGTWLGISRNMRFAAITNFRAPDNKIYQSSRGEIPKLFLNSSLSALDFANKMQEGQYAGFNALLFDGENLVYYHNQINSDKQIIVLPAGKYGLSNHLLNTPWPKVERTKKALETADTQLSNSELTQHLLSALQDQRPALDSQLPDTGFGIELERMLSPAFISSPAYGTRTSTVVIIEQSESIAKSIHFHERQYFKSIHKFEDQHHQILEKIS